MDESGWFLASDISKIRVLLSGTLPQTLDLENFATIGRSLKRVIHLAPEKWQLKLGRRRSTKLTIPASSDSRPLVYHSDCQARFRRADLLATTYTCYHLTATVHKKFSCRGGTVQCSVSVESYQLQHALRKILFETFAICTPYHGNGQRSSWLELTKLLTYA